MRGCVLCGASPVFPSYCIVCEKCRGAANGNRSALTSYNSGSGAAGGLSPGAITPVSYAALQALAQRNAAAHQNALALQGLANMAPMFSAGSFVGPHPLAAYLDQAQIGSAKPLERGDMRVGEIVGYRIWRVDNGYLKSFSYPISWMPGHPISGKPGDHDSAGIWAFKDPHRALHKMLETPDSVMGSVYLWGEIVEHADGYRAEFAEVRSIEEQNIYRGNWRWGRRAIIKELMDDLRARYVVES